ncbi:MAG: putative lactonase precursor [Oscillospiraceae bacterium]|nr:putative lactonase precursor [Oscillospiraceae bacterium]
MANEFDIQLQKLMTENLPQDVINLPVIMAEPWVLIDGDTEHPGMEGPIFDKEGNFYVCRSAPVPGFNSTIIKITPGQEMSVFYQAGQCVPVGIAIHKDGRFFVACLTGELLVLTPDGTLVRTLYPKHLGESLSMNDLVFDQNGNLYITDFRGLSNNPIGGVYRLDADYNYEKVIQITGGLALANGISLTPEGDALWIGESGRNAIVRIRLDQNGMMDHFAGLSYIYYNTGDCSPDSNKVDSDGNLYQTIMMGGRIIVLNKSGTPVTNVMVPGRQEGRNLMTPNLVIKPGTKQAYMLASGPDGSWVYTFTALAEAQVLYSHMTG